MLRTIKNEQIFILAVLCGFFLATANSFFKKPVPLSRADYLAPPKVIVNLSAGLKVQAADSFWLRGLQDFDFCDQPVNKMECVGQSWLFHILDLTTDLDPKFFSAFFYGGLSLTVVVNDFAGATQIFDKGVAEFPTNWILLYAAAYHAATEEKDKVKASKLYFAAAKYGAPIWVNAMAGRLAGEGGDEKYAELILQQMIDSAMEPKLIERLQQKLQKIKSEKK